jgi:hypothetical protein
MKANLGCFAVLLLSGCIDFDAKLDAGASLDSGAFLVDDASVSMDAAVSLDGGELVSGCPGFTSGEGFCWVNPTPMGEDLAAILYRGEDDVWVSGGAVLLMHGRRLADGGFHWDDFQLTDMLATPSDTQPSVNALVGLPDGGVLALGDSIPVMAWNGTTWRGLDLTTRLIDAAALNTQTGVVRGVGTNNVWVDILPNGDFSETISGGGQGWAVIAQDGGFVVGVSTDTNVGVLQGDFPLQGPILLSQSEYDPFALWSDDSGNVWFAGNGCKVGRVQPPYVMASPGTLCTTTTQSFWRAGVFSPALRKHLLVGSAGSIVEATDAQLTQSGVAPGRFNAGAVPSADVTFRALALTADGGALAVGNGAYIVERGATSWRAHELRLRSRLHAVVPMSDGGTLIIGNDGVRMAPSTTGDDSPLRPLTPGLDFVAAWHDGQRLWAVTPGQLFVESNDQLVRQQDFSGEQVTAISGHAGVDFAVVGLAGFYRYQRADAGAEYRVDPSLALTGIAPRDTGFVISAAGEPSDGGARFGRLYSGDATGLQPSGEVDFRLWAVTAIEGTVFAVGDGSQGVRSVNGSTLEVQQLTSPGQRGGTFNALAAKSPSDVWAVGTNGLASHFDGQRWTAVETGTRRDLLAVGFSGDGRWVWMVGDSGTILRKRVAP